MGGMDMGHAGRAVVVDTAGSPFARLKPVGVDRVSLVDKLWAPRMEINQRTMIPDQYRVLEDTGRMDNLRAAGGLKDAAFRGMYFNDSDVYKWVEAASWGMVGGGSAAIARDLEEAVKVICAAQQDDGYLNSYFMGDKAGLRWSNLRDMHELYCAGHFIQAAVANKRATGDPRLLATARRLADHIDGVFGPPGSGKKEGAPGHEEIEMALVELWRQTREKRYLDLAGYFVSARGKGLAGGDAYHQDHKRFTQMAEVTGHAVRAVYLNAGAADLLAENGDAAIGAALEKMWTNMVERRMYVTGGIGARHEGEAFGSDFELPNARAYSETCAAIGNAMWSWRMFVLDGDAKYMDIFELALLNGVLPGVSLGGKSYSYVNPLETDGGHRRSAWFDCACCPPNVARMLASVPGYFFCVSKEGVWVNMYASGIARIMLQDSREVTLKTETGYPWNGRVDISVGGEGEFTMFLRIPGWCEGACVSVNGQAAEVEAAPGSYAALKRDWRPGDEVTLYLPMEAVKVKSHPRVLENTGRVALMRGPIVYCVEKADNPGGDVRDLVISGHGAIEAEWKPELGGGVIVLKGTGRFAPPDEGWNGVLYRSRRARPGAVRANLLAAARLIEEHKGKVPFIAVPYNVWGNREGGPMSVWVRAEGETLLRSGSGS